MNIDHIIADWLAMLPNNIATKLDKSPESLLVLGEYLVTRFQSPNEVRDISNKAELDAIVSYIGEVYRLHFPTGGIWRINYELGPLRETRYTFHAEVGISCSNGGQHPLNQFLI